MVKYWNGFTRDFQQLERTYGKEDTAIDVNECLNDLYTYELISVRVWSCTTENYCKRYIINNKKFLLRIDFFEEM